MTETTVSDTKLVARLNDLLQLDHDAIAAYTVAIDTLQNESWAEPIRRFRTDHERHVFELTHLVRVHHGTPVEMPHMPTGAVKLAVQRAGAIADDTGILVAFKTNERQSRDKYHAAAQADLPEDVRMVLQRGAADEARHYGWVTGVLEQLGHGGDTFSGRAQGAFEAGHTAMASAAEAAERKATYAKELGMRAMRGRNPLILLGAAVLIIGAGALAANVLRRSKLTN